MDVLVTKFATIVASAEEKEQEDEQYPPVFLFSLQIERNMLH